MNIFDFNFGFFFFFCDDCLLLVPFSVIERNFDKHRREGQKQWAQRERGSGCGMHRTRRDTLFNTDITIFVEFEGVRVCRLAMGDFFNGTRA